MQKYQEVRVLGEGSYGKAFLCRRKRDGLYVVVKEVRFSAMDKRARADSQQEAQILASLDHSFIVKYFESFEERGYFYIVMEYADSGDLADFLERRTAPLSEPEILKIFIQICLAIKYIHDKRILHRDLKCKNIFLMKDGTVKLGDFGIARVLEHTFQLCNTQIGTPFYLSPEICAGKPYNSKTDIWSLGCILYELCTLRRAFSAQNMNSLFANIMKGKYDAISKRFSTDLQSLLATMLTCDPKMRPSINAVLSTPLIKEHLARFLQASAPQESPGRVPLPPTSPPSRKMRPVLRCISGNDLDAPVEEVAVPRPRKRPPQSRKCSEDLIVQPKPLKPDLMSQLRGRPSRDRNVLAVSVRRKSAINEDSFLREARAAEHGWAVLPPKEISPFLKTADERTLTLEQHRADLEATRKLVEEFGTLTRQQMDEFSPLPMGSVKKAQSRPEMEPLNAGQSVELARSRLSRIHELAGSIKEALDIQNGSDDEFEAAGPPTQIFVNNQAVSFPVVSDSDSLAYRAEAIRAFLEGELGDQKLLELRDEIEGQAIRDVAVAKDVQPGIVILMHHLMVLDQMILDA